jgi:hypothetical protein
MRADSDLLEELRRAGATNRGELHPSYAKSLLRRCLESMEKDRSPAEQNYRAESIVATAWMKARFGDVI